jgi:hypothetical protein
MWDIIAVSTKHMKERLMSKNVAARNRAIKRYLTKDLGLSGVSITGGRGTAYGWVSVSVAVPQEIVERSEKGLTYNDKRAKHQFLIDIEKKIEAAFSDELFYYYSDGPEADKRSCLIVQQG